MAVNINKLNGGKPSFFTDNGAMLLFDEISDYSTANLASLVNPIDVCDILQDSTSWDGDDITVETVKNEQGKAVITYPQEGTFAFSFNVMSTDTATVKKLLKGKDITGTVGAWMTGAKALGVGGELASFVCPVGWCNNDLNQVLIFPKARVTAGFTYDNNVLLIHVNVTAEKVDTKDLQTVVMLAGAKLDYGASEAS